MNAATLERRQMTRHAVDFPVRFRQGRRTIEGRATDYSVCGMRVALGTGAWAMLDVVQPVEVAFLDASGREVGAFAGALRWVAGEFCGVENVSLAREEAA